MKKAFDQEQAQRFLKLLHHGLYGLVAFFFLKGKQHVQVFAAPETIPDRVIRHVHGGWHVYVTPCTFASERREEANAVMAPGVWVDVDPPDGRDDPAWRRDTLEAILRFRVRPTIVVHSGRGFHAHWLFDQPLDLQEDEGEGNLALLRGCNRVLITELHGDPSLKPASSYLRLAGTPNFKDGASDCKVLYAKGPRYTLAELVEALGATEDPPGLPSSSGAGTRSSGLVEVSDGEPPTSCRIRVADLKSLSPRHRKLVREGVSAWRPFKGRKTTGDRSRSAAELAAVGEMVRAGWTDGLIQAAFERDDWRIGDRFRELRQVRGERHATENLERTIRKARQSKERTG